MHNIFLHKYISLEDPKDYISTRFLAKTEIETYFTNYPPLLSTQISPPGRQKSLQSLSIALPINTGISQGKVSSSFNPVYNWNSKNLNFNHAKTQITPVYTEKSKNGLTYSNN